MGKATPDSQTIPPVIKKATGINPSATRAHQLFGMVRTWNALANSPRAALEPSWRVTRVRAAVIGTQAITALMGKAGAKGKVPPMRKTAATGQGP